MGARRKSLSREGIPRRFLRAAVLAAVAGALSCAAVARGRLVDVGGHRLHIRCAGRGTPAVVLDAGAGDTLATWDAVFPDLARLTTVCAYDRAGLGSSDPGPKPRTSGRIAQELHSLLRLSGVPGPYILVGHSFGGLTVRLFASRYPEEAAGLVLVDGTPEDFPAREARWRSDFDREKLRTYLSLARPAFSDEIEAMEVSAEEVRSADIPDVPVVVLAATHPNDSESFRSNWIAMQRAVAGSLPRATTVVAERSDHYIQFDRPDLILHAVSELIARSRHPPAPSPPVRDPSEKPD